MKHRTPGSVFIPLLLLIVLAAFMMVIPINHTPKSGLVGIPYNAWHQILNVLSHWIVWVVLLLTLLMLLVVNNINKVIERKKFARLSPAEQSRYLEEAKIPYLKRWLRSSRERQTDEEEQEILLDHGFDGIKELDNALPQWWVAMFYLGIVYCVIYVIAYFTTDFAHPAEEYEVETARLEQGFTDWVKANDIKVEQADMANANVEHGKEIFTNVCATCHTSSGGGAAGPNLTDANWINHLNDDLYKNIYTIVYDGSPNNPAMQAFGQTKQLTGLDIQDVAAYVHVLNQETPPVTEAEGGLAPQGDVVDAWKRK